MIVADTDILNFEVQFVTIRMATTYDCVLAAIPYTDQHGYVSISTSDESLKSRLIVGSKVQMTIVKPPAEHP